MFVQNVPSTYMVVVGLPSIHLLIPMCYISRKGRPIVSSDLLLTLTFHLRVPPPVGSQSVFLLVFPVSVCCPLEPCGRLLPRSLASPAPLMHPCWLPCWPLAPPCSLASSSRLPSPAPSRLPAPFVCCPFFLLDARYLLAAISLLARCQFIANFFFTLFCFAFPFFLLMFCLQVLLAKQNASTASPRSKINRVSGMTELCCCYTPGLCY